LADSLMTPEQIESANAFMEKWRSYGTDKAWTTQEGVVFAL
jgi:hypothetical protein